jgi:nucleotide-binding universal stress UspA family protein
VAVSEIFVPLDGGATSLRALPVARALADRLGARLTAVTVSAPSVDCGPVLRWLDAQADAFDAGTIAIVASEPAPALLELAAGAPGSLLCMTSQGRSGVRQLVFGSVSGEVVRTCPAPVVVVGPRALPSTRSSVLVCVHGPPARVVGPAEEWSVAMGGPAWVVAVDDPEDVLWSDTPTAHDVEVVAGRLRRAGVPTEVVVLHGKDPAAELLDASVHVGAGLVLAATAARVGVHDVLLPSVARRLVREASCPVVLVGPACAGRRA